MELAHTPQHEPAMARPTLKDEDWPKLKSILLHQGVYDKPDLRNTVEGILHRIRAGCPWRDLPQEFGRWNNIYQRLRVCPPKPPQKVARPQAWQATGPGQPICYSTATPLDSWQWRCGFWTVSLSSSGGIRVCTNETLASVGNTF